ncbi:hypothetical protein E3N88_26458 [Mikania micrantha]|uniref:Tracheary element differentiation-related 6 n=1 Tax=Mikania micrantha TaxID=192012 RepID=A0A5N6N7L0_9ASTR|nr:hypothetical protein E3N88_26458 [Mikania micrantha]
MTTIFVVFVSFGCVFFLGLALLASCFIVKKLKCSKTTSKEEMVHVDEHLQVRKNMVQGPNGVEDVSITVEDDLHVDKQEESMKNEKVGKHLHKIPNDAFHAQSSTSQA